MFGNWLQDSEVPQEQLTRESCRTKRDVSSVMRAKVFPKVDICVLFPNVFTSQEVFINLDFL